MKIKFQNIGWKSKITQKRATFSISINKLVATGCSLEKGRILYCYLARDNNNRPIMLVYLDSKEISKQDFPILSNKFDKKEV